MQQPADMEGRSAALTMGKSKWLLRMPKGGGKGETKGAPSYAQVRLRPWRPSGSTSQHP